MWQAKDISEIEKNFRTNINYGLTSDVNFIKILW